MNKEDVVAAATEHCTPVATIKDSTVNLKRKTAGDIVTFWENS